MKRSILSILLLISCSISAYSNEIIPIKFQGTWLIDGIAKGDWDAITVTENHIEFFYDLYKVDSVVAKPAGSQFFLSSQAGKHTSVIINSSGNSIATFKYDEWDVARTCKLVSKHPDMIYYDAAKTSEILKGEWIIGRDFKNIMSISNQKILLDGKNWNMVWFGEYLGREYRALLQNEQKYQLVYLKKNGRMLSISGAGWSHSYALKAKNNDVYQVLGNWYHPITNEWTFGFTEDLAIYKGKFWDYEVMKTTGNSTSLVLKDGGNKVALQIFKRSDSILEITTADKRKISYKLAGKTLPAYPSEDKSVFKNTHFKKVDTAYITGYLRNQTNKEPITMYSRNIFNNDQEKYIGEIDEFGKFSIKIPLLNTTVVYFNSGVGTMFDVIEPGERYLMSYDFDSKQHLVMGNNSRLHNELANYQPFSAFGNGDAMADNDKLKGLAFLAAKKSQLSTANQFSEQYLITVPMLSERAKIFIKSFNKYYIASDLMQKRFDLDRANREKFPEEYMAYVKDSLMTNIPSPFTVAFNITTFITDYVQYYQQFDEQVSIVHEDVIKDLIANDKIKVLQEDKPIFIRLATLDSDTSINSIQNKAIRESIGEDKIKSFDNFRIANKSLIQAKATQLLWETTLNNDMTSFEKLLPNEDMRKSFQASAIYNYLERTREALEPKKFASLIAKINAPGVAENLIKYQNHLLQVPNQDFAYAESLKRTDHLKGAKNADSLLKALLLPYRGKVVYLDFWGTWCGPCREEMKYVGKAKEAVKDKDVIFMYFANNSPELTWKNMIKELNLTGENVVHYRLPEEQQYLIESRLSIKAFPTYILIDKEGNIVNSAAPRPSNPMGLLKEIDTMLSR
jgi:thiol-disulfide isomerase/thioredoxin